MTSLRPRDKPELLEPLKSKQEGTKVVLECKWLNHTRVSWLRNEVPIFSTKDMTISEARSSCTLTIHRANKEHNGQYMCTASNLHGKSSTYCQLTVVAAFEGKSGRFSKLNFPGAQSQKATNQTFKKDESNCNSEVPSPKINGVLLKPKTENAPNNVGRHFTIRPTHSATTSHPPITASPVDGKQTQMKASFQSGRQLSVSKTTPTTLTSTQSSKSRVFDTQQSNSNPQAPISSQALTTSPAPMTSPAPKSSPATKPLSSQVSWSVKKPAAAYKPVSFEIEIPGKPRDSFCADIAAVALLSNKLQAAQQQENAFMALREGLRPVSRSTVTHQPKSTAKPTLDKSVSEDLPSNKRELKPTISLESFSYTEQSPRKVTHSASSSTSDVSTEITNGKTPPSRSTSTGSTIKDRVALFNSQEPVTLDIPYYLKRSDQELSQPSVPKYNDTKSTRNTLKAAEASQSEDSLSGSSKSYHTASSTANERKSAPTSQSGSLTDTFDYESCVSSLSGGHLSFESLETVGQSQLGCESSFYSFSSNSGSSVTLRSNSFENITSSQECLSDSSAFATPEEHNVEQAFSLDQLNFAALTEGVETQLEVAESVFEIDNNKPNGVLKEVVFTNSSLHDVRNSVVSQVELPYSQALHSSSPIVISANLSVNSEHLSSAVVRDTPSLPTTIMSDEQDPTTSTVVDNDGDNTLEEGAKPSLGTGRIANLSKSFETSPEPQAVVVTRGKRSGNITKTVDCSVWEGKGEMTSEDVIKANTPKGSGGGNLAAKLKMFSAADGAGAPMEFGVHINTTKNLDELTKQSKSIYISIEEQKKRRSQKEEPDESTSKVTTILPSTSYQSTVKVEASQFFMQHECSNHSVEFIRREGIDRSVSYERLDYSAFENSDYQPNKSSLASEFFAKTNNSDDCELLGVDSFENMSDTSSCSDRSAQITNEFSTDDFTTADEAVLSSECDFEDDYFSPPISTLYDDFSETLIELNELANDKNLTSEIPEILNYVDSDSVDSTDGTVIMATDCPTQAAMSQAARISNFIECFARNSAESFHALQSDVLPTEQVIPEGILESELKAYTVSPSNLSAVDCDERRGSIRSSFDIYKINEESDEDIAKSSPRDAVTCDLPQALSVNDEISESRDNETNSLMPSCPNSSATQSADDSQSVVTTESSTMMHDILAVEDMETSVAKFILHSDTDNICNNKLFFDKTAQFDVEIVSEISKSSTPKVALFSSGKIADVSSDEDDDVFSSSVDVADSALPINTVSNAPANVSLKTSFLDEGFCSYSEVMEGYQLSPGGPYTHSQSFGESQCSENTHKQYEQPVSESKQTLVYCSPSAQTSLTEQPVLLNDNSYSKPETKANQLDSCKISINDTTQHKQSNAVDEVCANPISSMSVEQYLSSDSLNLSTSKSSQVEVVSTELDVCSHDIPHGESAIVSDSNINMCFANDMCKSMEAASFIDFELSITLIPLVHEVELLYPLLKRETLYSGTQSYCNQHLCITEDTSPHFNKQNFCQIIHEVINIPELNASKQQVINGANIRKCFTPLSYANEYTYPDVFETAMCYADVDQLYLNADLTICSTLSSLECIWPSSDNSLPNQHVYVNDVKATSIQTPSQCLSSNSNVADSSLSLTDALATEESIFSLDSNLSSSSLDTPSDANKTDQFVGDSSHDAAEKMLENRSVMYKFSETMIMATPSNLAHVLPRVYPKKASDTLANTNYETKNFGSSAEVYVNISFVEDFACCSKLSPSIEKLQPMLSNCGCVTSPKLCPVSICSFSNALYTDQLVSVDCYVSATQSCTADIMNDFLHTKGIPINSPKESTYAVTEVKHDDFELFESKVPESMAFGNCNQIDLLENGNVFCQTSSHAESMICYRPVSVCDYLPQANVHHEFQAVASFVEMKTDLECASLSNITLEKEIVGKSVAFADGTSEKVLKESSVLKQTNCTEKVAKQKSLTIMAIKNGSREFCADIKLPSLQEPLQNKTQAMPQEFSSPIHSVDKPPKSSPLLKTDSLENYDESSSRKAIPSFGETNTDFITVTESKTADSKGLLGLTKKEPFLLPIDTQNCYQPSVQPLSKETKFENTQLLPFDSSQHTSKPIPAYKNTAESLEFSNKTPLEFYADLKMRLLQEKLAGYKTKSRQSGKNTENQRLEVQLPAWDSNDSLLSASDEVQCIETDPSDVSEAGAMAEKDCGDNFHSPEEKYQDIECSELESSPRLEDVASRCEERMMDDAKVELLTLASVEPKSGEAFNRADLTHASIATQLSDHYTTKSRSSSPTLKQVCETLQDDCVDLNFSKIEDVWYEFKDQCVELPSEYLPSKCKMVLHHGIESSKSVSSMQPLLVMTFETQITLSTSKLYSGGRDTKTPNDNIFQDDSIDNCISHEHKSVSSSKTSKGGYLERNNHAASNVDVSKPLQLHTSIDDSLNISNANLLTPRPLLSISSKSPREFYADLKMQLIREHLATSTLSNGTCESELPPPTFY
ncbi:hypothetical protein EB796_003965 [Bugula neritina]|uniref:Ig-like domain-containing protein n=1 Tax=Bugula neritina TaxID=10212 RepID=A0A7J7KII0_BUGNE|nr:hypothetical protein EB796_003965 [Bugula neritina]